MGKKINVTRSSSKQQVTFIHTNHKGFDTFDCIIFFVKHQGGVFIVIITTTRTQLNKDVPEVQGILSTLRRDNPVTLHLLEILEKLQPVNKSLKASDNMNELTIFNYSGKDVRTVEIYGQIWWVLKDVCAVLVLSNPSKVAQRLDDDEVTNFELGGQSGLSNIVNESGLYNVILRSDKLEAKAFKRWVTHEVLPSIRQTGNYSAQPLTPAQLALQQAQLLVDMERKLNEVQAATAAMQDTTQKVKNKLDTAIEIFAKPLDNSWKNDINERINKMCLLNGLPYQSFKSSLYSELEQVAHCNIGDRQTRLRNRMLAAGATKKEIQAVSKLDIVDRDPKLRAVFDGIVRKYQAKYIA